MGSHVASHLLGRRHHDGAADAIRFLGRLSLAPGRVHEVCGAARRTLALIVASAMQGEVFWISPLWEADRLNGDGIADFIEPGRLICVTPQRAEDLLWCAEETLRSGAVPLIVADLPGPPALTPVRRLHLAAEAGASRGTTPLGLILTPEGAAPGIESRWGFAQTAGGWRLDRLRSRADPPATWNVASQDRALAPAA
jgi:protein ImuA